MAFALFGVGCAARPRLLPYTTDGCSLFPDGTVKHSTAWLHCCEEHDRKYWRGGVKAERRNADRALRACVAAEGYPATAKVMLAGTRAGGTPYLPTRFRWGYGWKYPRGYKALDGVEKKLIEESR